MDKLLYVAMSGAKETLRAQAANNHNLAREQLKPFFQNDQQTQDTMNISFNCGSKTLILEMRI